MAKSTFKKGEVVEAVLKILALFTIVGGSIIFPNLPIVVGLILKLIKEINGKKVSSQKVKNALKIIEKRKIIRLVKDDENVYVQFLKENHNELLKYSIKNLLDFKTKKHEWKKQWVLITFDIPEIERRKRVYVRSFLKQLGFFPYQQSVYIFPYECKEEVQLIKKITDSDKYLKYIIATELEDETTAKIFFKLY